MARSHRTDSTVLVAHSVLEDRALAEAALPCSENASPHDLQAWVGQAYPIVAAALVSACARVGDAACDDVLTAFVDQRLTIPTLCAGVARADRPTAYLRRAARHFAIDRARRLSARGEGEDLRRLGLEIGEDGAEGERATERSDETAAADRARLTAIAAMPTRDRVVLLASWLGPDALPAADRAWVAARRGTTADALDAEIAAETARCEAIREAARGELARVEETVAALTFATHRAWRSYKTHPTAEGERAVTSASDRLHAASARGDALRRNVDDPFGGAPSRRAIAQIVGEGRGGSIDAAANSTWKQAARLRDRLCDGR